MLAWDRLARGRRWRLETVSELYGRLVVHFTLDYHSGKPFLLSRSGSPREMREIP